VNRARIFIAVATIGIATISASLAVRADGKSKPPVPAPLAGHVQLAKVRTTMITAKSEVTGAQPGKALQFGFEVPGRLAQLTVKKGARVDSGQLIARLDPEIADAQVAQAEAAVKAAEANAAVANDAAKRQAELRAGNNVSDQQASASASQALAADAQVLAAKAQLAQMRAARKRHDLRAPFAGVLVDEPDQVGANVAPNASMFTLEQLDPLSLRATASESDRPKLILGAKVRVESTASDLTSDDAFISSIIPSADAQTRRVPIEISVPNKQGRFVAHTLARAVLPLGAQEPALAVSATALASTGGDHLFVLAEGGTVRRVPVQVIERGPKEVIFRCGEPLEQVVDYPAVDLDTGMKVSVSGSARAR
jgi:RND family efflux transporter MFP subunit